MVYVAIVGYSVDNLRSIKGVFERVRATPIIASSSSDVEKAGMMVLSSVSSLKNITQSLGHRFIITCSPRIDVAKSCQVRL